MDSLRSQADQNEARHSRAPTVPEAPFSDSPRRRYKMMREPPQKSIDDFWSKFTTKHPGKVFTILPDNLYAKRAAKAFAPPTEGKVASHCENAVRSYDEAVKNCEAKVAKIVRECRRINQKYRDPHFDIESDFKRSRQYPGTPADCLVGIGEERTDLQPLSVKRVEVGTTCSDIPKSLLMVASGHLRETGILHRRRERKRCSTGQRRRLLVHVRTLHTEQ